MLDLDPKWEYGSADTLPLRTFPDESSGEQAQKHGKMYLLSALMSKILQKKLVVFLIKSRDRDR